MEIIKITQEQLSNGGCLHPFSETTDKGLICAKCKEPINDIINPGQKDLRIKYEDAVDRVDLLEKYVEELADGIIEGYITKELRELAHLYRSKLSRI